MTFDELNLNPTLLEGLEAMGFREATPIQEQAIPMILENKDIIATAQTGTGKTAAFLLPVLNKLASRESTETTHINTLVVVPTRELAGQIDKMLQGFAYYIPISSIAMYGGVDGASFIQQKKAFTEGADIIISTPGILISHLNMSYVNFDHLEHFILDEGDKMLDMGFYKDILRISKYLPESRQTLLFSATMPPKIKKLASEILKEPVHVSTSAIKPATGVTQIAYVVYEEQKILLANHILKVHQQFKSIIIFCSRKTTVKSLLLDLKESGFSACEIHSDLEQREREQIVQDFKNRKYRILIGTDVISRGLDIDGIDLVINYEVPQNSDEYVHRVGRTARHSSTGLGYAFTFISEKEQYKFIRIEKELDIEVTRFEPPGYIGEGPKLAEPKAFRESKPYKERDQVKNGKNGKNPKRKFFRKKNA
ncbi:MAG: DEAD/DEAH box helicase [Microscillaceae bacterium]|nr:DEAD/DEAH box helicase [Microscillaceae bacterium]